jgi:hypothetical protein
VGEWILWAAAATAVYCAIGWALAWLLTEEPERYQYRLYGALSWPLIIPYLFGYMPRVKTPKAAKGRESRRDRMAAPCASSSQVSSSQRQSQMPTR